MNVTGRKTRVLVETRRITDNAVIDGWEGDRRYNIDQQFADALAEMREQWRLNERNSITFTVLVE